MDKIEKFFLKLTKKERSILSTIFAEIKILKLASYDIKQLTGYKGIFRIRKGQMRIIFAKTTLGGTIISIAYRKDVYKNL